MTTPTLTEAELSELRRLLAEATPGGNKYVALTLEALPGLLDAAEREQKLREALRNLSFAVDRFQDSPSQDSDDWPDSLCDAAIQARAALAIGGAR